MSSATERLARLGIHVPEILLPKEGNDLNKWSVIACDQFTSEKDYWERCITKVGSSPSTLNLIFPECFLTERDQQQETEKINNTMKLYLADELQSPGKGLVYIDRSTPWVKSRKGLVLALDLDSYDFQEGTQTAIRPTEATVVDRLPPRIKVRKEAVLDLPHILVLINDPQNKVMKAASESAKKTIYDFDLMEEGGHISGEMIEEQDALNALADAFEALNQESPFLFAIGDGNHSLASAKEIWREMKASGVEDHPCRYALVEVENIHDKGLVFEPIHRILFDVNPAELAELCAKSLNAEVQEVCCMDTLRKKVEAPGANCFGVYDGNTYKLYDLKPQENRLVAEIFHDFLDPWLEKNSSSEADYIHGDEAFIELSLGEKNLGFYLPSIDKNRFFDLVDKKGSLPRKTFSIGEAQEKRYYLEARKLIK